MSETESRAARLALLGGTLCLDFTNTAGDRSTDHPAEYLLQYSDLVAWSQHADILTPPMARQLLKKAARQPAAARAALKRARTCRETLHRIFSALVAGNTPAPAELETFNHLLASALAHSRIGVTQNQFTWTWADNIELDRMLWSILRSAVDLLTLGDWHKVRQCGNETCGWLFIDTSRNHSRRWCAMNDCGNRAKARRHYQRLHRMKQKSKPGEPA